MLEEDNPYSFESIEVKNLKKNISSCGNDCYADKTVGTRNSFYF